MHHEPIRLEKHLKDRDTDTPRRTLDEVGKILGCSREYVRQVERTACMKLLQAAVKEFGKEWEAMGMPLPCQEKRAYTTDWEARRAAKGRTLNGVPYLRVYACPDCGCYHLTKKKPGEHKKGEVKNG